MHEPTFYHGTGNSLLDVLVTNQCRRFASAGAIQNEIIDGHSLIYGALRLKCPKLTPVDIEFRSFKNFDKDNLLKDLQSAPFSVSKVFDDPGDSLWATVHQHTNIFDEHVPLKRKRIRKKQQAFFNSKFKKAVMTKRHLLKKYKNFPTNENWERYRKQWNICTDIRRKSIKNYVRDRCIGGPKNSDIITNNPNNSYDNWDLV